MNILFKIQMEYSCAHEMIMKFSNDFDLGTQPRYTTPILYARGIGIKTA